MEIVEDKRSKQPSIAATREFTLRCQQKGLILGNSPEQKKNIIRILPGFVITKEQVDQALSIMEVSLNETMQALGRAQPVAVSVPAR